MNDLEAFIEVRRQAIFENNAADLPSGYDWQADWYQAQSIHRANIDWVQNKKRHHEDLRKIWSEWEGRVNSNGLAVSLEALKAMIVVNGGTIIASLAVLSGQISNPTKGAVIAASVMILFSIISLMMMATGQALIVHSTTSIATTVRAAIVSYTRHSRLYAIDRLCRRHLNPKLRIAEALIYGSIAVFGLSAFVSAIIVVVIRG